MSKTIYSLLIQLMISLATIVDFVVAVGAAFDDILRLLLTVKSDLVELGPDAGENTSGDGTNSVDPD